MRVTQGLACPAVGATHGAYRPAKSQPGKGRRPPKEEVSLRDIDPIQFQVSCKDWDQETVQKYPWCLEMLGNLWLDLPWFASTISLNYLNLVTICWENTLSFSAGPACRWLFAATAIHLRRPRLKVVAIAMPYSLWCLILSFGTLSLSHCVLLSPTIDRPWDGLVAACCGTPWCNVVVPGWTKNWLTCGYTLVQSTWTSRLNCRLVPRLGSCWIAAESKGRVCRANKCKLSIVYHSIPCVSMFFH